MTVVLDKIQVLKEAYPSEAEFDRVPSKLLDNALGQYRLRLQRYEQDLRQFEHQYGCLLYTSPSPRDRTRSRMPSSA